MSHMSASNCVSDRVPPQSQDHKEQSPDVIAMIYARVDAVMKEGLRD